MLVVLASILRLPSVQWVWRFAARPTILLFVVSSIVFLAFSVLPSDPIWSMVGVNASQDAVVALRHEFGYDRPLLARYCFYLGSLVRLDLGKSLVTRRAVGPDLWNAYGVTLLYVGVALAASVILSFGLMLLGYFSHALVARGLLNVAAFITSFPSLLVATTTGVLIVRFNLFHAVSNDYRGFLMATAALAVYPTFSLADIAQRAGAEASLGPASMALRSFGYSELRVFTLGVLRPALSPWLGHLSNIAAGLVGGSIIVEAVFSLPGVGRLLVQSVLRGDLPMMQGLVTVSTIIFLALDTATRALGDYLVGNIYR